MKRYRFLLVLILALLRPAPSGSQTPLAWYPLQSDGADATGNNGDLNLVNVEFVNGSVYCNGIYSGDPGGHLVQTPLIPAMNFDSFAVSVEFRFPGVDGQDDWWRPIIVCGGSFRYLFARFEPDSSITLGMNNNAILATSNERPAPDTWHHLVLAYSAATTTAALYLDGKPVATAAGVLDHGTDRDVLSVNPGTGKAFEGYLRHLVVYDGAFDPTPVRGTTWGGIKALLE